MGKPPVLITAKVQLESFFFKKRRACDLCWGVGSSGVLFEPQSMLGGQARRIRADAEVRRVAERDDAGVAEDQVERQRKQRGDGDLARQLQIRRRGDRSEEHTSELQSLAYLVCRLLLEKKKKTL